MRHNKISPRLSFSGLAHKKTLTRHAGCQCLGGGAGNLGGIPRGQFEPDPRLQKLNHVERQPGEFGIAPGAANSARIAGLSLLACGETEAQALRAAAMARTAKSRNMG